MYKIKKTFTFYIINDHLSQAIIKLKEGENWWQLQNESAIAEVTSPWMAAGPKRGGSRSLLCNIAVNFRIMQQLVMLSHKTQPLYSILNFCIQLMLVQWINLAGPVEMILQSVRRANINEYQIMKMNHSKTKKETFIWQSKSER